MIESDSRLGLTDWKELFSDWKLRKLLMIGRAVKR